MSGEHVLRHQLADRLYHWTMAAALLACLFTAFLPILGWKFEWVTAHWIAGIVLTAAILFHIVRAVLWQDFWSMVIGPRDLRSSWRFWRGRWGVAGPPPQRDAKYSPLQKSFHMLVAAVVAGNRGDRPADAEQDRYAVLAAQSVLAGGLSMGDGLRDPWPVRDGDDHADHGTCLFRGASREAVDDALHVPRLDFPRGLSAPP